MSDLPVLYDLLPEEGPDDSVDAGLRAAFSPQEGRPGDREESVVAHLRDTTGISPRILLRDLQHERAPVEKPQSSGGPDVAGTIENYQVFGEIARGGMGIVLKGRDPELGRDVALKVLHSQHASSAEMVRRFVEEAQIGGQMQHPGIVPIYELGLSADRRPYFAMKMVKGRTLASLLESRAKPSEDRRRLLGIFEQVCQTVAYAHARGVIHRDLKPSNVMVGAFGEVQVMDWGLAKVLEEGRGPDEREAPNLTIVRTLRSGTPGSTSIAGSVMGTPPYMPPEQARGEIEALDERTDVFALGAILCEILTGKPPYSGKTRDQVRIKAETASLGEAFARLDGCGVDEELVRIAKGCLSPVPEDRPRDAGVVARDVGAFLASEEERARASELAAAAARARAAEERRARRLTLGLAASVLGSLVLGGAGYVWVERDRRARVMEITRRVESALGEATVLWGQAKSSPAGDLSKWAAALSAARGAEEMARGPGGDENTRGRVRALLEGLEKEEIEARRVALQVEADNRMVQRLDEIFSSAGERWTDAHDAVHQDVADTGTSLENFLLLDQDAPDAAHQDAAYTTAFRAYGIELDALDPAAAAERIRSSPVMPNLVAALDDWVHVRRESRTGDEGRRRLLQIVRSADPDPWRRKLRDASESADLEDLRSLAGSPVLEDLHAPSLVLLGSSLGNAGDPETAVNVLRVAQARFPGSHHINVSLAFWLQRLNPPRWEEAARYHTAALALAPQSANRWHDLGQAMQEGGDLEGAWSAFSEMLRLKPGDADGFVHRGQLLQRKRDTEGAIAMYREAIRIEPNYARAHLVLGNTFRDRGDLDSGIAAYREAIRVEPNYADAFTGLGIALGEKGHLEEAVVAFREAIRIKPDSAEAYYNLGRALQLKTDLDPAIAAYREATRIRPDHAAARNNLGLALRDSGDVDRAIAEFRRALEVEPENAVAHNNLGCALKDSRDLAGAIDEFRKAAAIDPNFATAHCNLGIVLEIRGVFPEAIAELRKTLEIEPNSMKAYLVLGNALWGNEEKEEAISAWRTYLRFEPRDGRAQQAVAWLLATCPEESLRDARRAVDLAGQAARLLPRAWACWYTLGVARYRAGNWEDCLDALAKSMELRSGGDAREWLFAAMARERLGEREAALEWFRKGVNWIEEEGRSPETDLQRFRAEAEELLGVASGGKR